jgi:hypothetical protein
VQVRERKASPIYEAYKLLQDQHVVLPSGHEVQAFIGEWVVCVGARVLDTLSPARFEQFYEVVGEAGLSIDPQDRTSLEKQLGFGSTRDSKTLTAAVSRLATLTIGDIQKNFSVAQWEEIARRAEKRRLSVSAYMDQIVEKLLQDLWTSAI